MHTYISLYPIPCGDLLRFAFVQVGENIYSISY